MVDVEECDSCHKTKCHSHHKVNAYLFKSGKSNFTLWRKVCWKTEIYVTSTFKPMCTVTIKPVVVTSNNLINAEDPGNVLDTYIKIFEDLWVPGLKGMSNREDCWVTGVWTILSYLLFPLIALLDTCWTSRDPI